MLGIAFVKDAMPKAEGYDRAVIISKYAGLGLEGEVVESGNDFYYFVNKNVCESAMKNLSSEKISGVVFYYNNKYNLNYFAKKFDYNLTKKTIVENREVYYGYDKNYYDFRIIDGKKVNFQLAFDGNNWILGYPMIILGF